MSAGTMYLAIEPVEWEQHPYSVRRTSTAAILRKPPHPPPLQDLTDPALSRAHISSLAWPKLPARLQSFISAIRGGRAGDVEAMLSSGTVDSTSGAHAVQEP